MMVVVVVVAVAVVAVVAVAVVVVVVAVAVVVVVAAAAAAAVVGFFLPVDCCSTEVHWTPRFIHNTVVQSRRFSGSLSTVD